jgi:CBS domain-containing protein
VLIRDFIKTRGPVVTCRPDDSIGDAADVLAQHKIGVMPVLDSHFKLVGMLSERDIVRVFAANKSGFAALKVGDVMSRNVVSCAPGNSHVDAANLMRRNRIRHLPVLEEEMLVGLISVRDMLEVFGPTDKQGVFVAA